MSPPSAGGISGEVQSLLVRGQKNPRTTSGEPRTAITWRKPDYGLPISDWRAP